MNITINRAEFVSALRHLSGAVHYGSTIPVMECALMTASADGLQLQATDLTTIAQCSLDAKVDDAGRVAVPMKKLLEYVGNVPTESIAIKSTPNHWVSITAGASSRARIAGFAGEDFPEVPMSFDGAISVPNPTFAEMAKYIEHVRLTEPLGGLQAGSVVLNLQGGALTFLSITGHRMAIASASGYEGTGSHVILDGSLAVVRKIAEGLDGSTRIAFTDRVACFECGNYRVGGRLIDVPQLPDWERALPKKHANQLTANREELLGAVRRACPFGWESKLIRGKGESVRIIITVEDSTLTIHAKGNGECEEKVPCMSTAPIRFGMNALYLMDCLGAMDAEDVILRYSDASRTMLLEPVGEGLARCRTVTAPMYLDGAEDAA